MINVDVLLQAAEFIEKQQQLSQQQQLQTSYSNVVDIAFSPLSSSPLSSSSSSSSSSTSPSSLSERHSASSHEQFLKQQQQQTNTTAISISGGKTTGDYAKQRTNGEPLTAAITSSYYGSRNNMNVSPPLPYPSPSSSSCSSSSSSSFSASSFENVRFNAAAPVQQQQQQQARSIKTQLSTTSEPKVTDDIKRDKAIHNTLEKNRRAHLKECFENLQNELPQYKDRKVTNLFILNYTLKYIEQTKKVEKEREMEKQRQLKRQNQLRHTLKRLIGELDAENFDYKSWITNNKEESATGTEYMTTPEAGCTGAEELGEIDAVDCSFGDDLNDFDDDDDSALSETSGKGVKKARKSPSKPLPQAQRRRCSNSLSVMAAAKSGTKTPPAPVALNFVRLTNLTKQNDLQAALTSNRQRHVSCDETMIMMNKQQQRRKRNSSSMNFGTTDSMADLLETEYDDEDLYDDTEDNSNDLEETIENARLKAAAAGDDDDDDSSTNELVINEDMQTDGAEAAGHKSTAMSPTGQALFAKKKRGRPSGGRNSFSSTSSTASISASTAAVKAKSPEEAVESAVKRSSTPTTSTSTTTTTCVLPPLTSTALTANIPSSRISTGFNYSPASSAAKFVVVRNGADSSSSAIANAAGNAASGSNSKPIIYLSNGSAPGATNSSGNGAVQRGESTSQMVLNKIPSVASSSAAVANFTASLFNTPLFKSLSTNPNATTAVHLANTQQQNLVRSKSPSSGVSGNGDQLSPQQQLSFSNSYTDYLEMLKIQKQSQKFNPYSMFQLAASTSPSFMAASSLSSLMAPRKLITLQQQQQPAAAATASQQEASSSSQAKAGQAANSSSSSSAK